MFSIKSVYITVPHNSHSTILCVLASMVYVEGKRLLCDLNVTSSSPALAKRHIRSVLLVNRTNKFNLLSWLLIYLCNK